jgi:hypothetical protein
VRFAATQVRLAMSRVSERGESEEVGRALGAQLVGPGLRHVLVLSNGLTVNGAALSEGLQAAVGSAVSVSGGLAGDGEAFSETLVLAGSDGGPTAVAAVGLYGDSLRVGYGSFGGWQPFGPHRTVTRSDGPVLFELDGKSALDKYKEYLGEHAAGLPASALLFPLLVTREGGERGVVRTVLATEQESGAMTFAGDVPLGARVQLMHAKTDGLVDGASQAAERALAGLGGLQPELGILVSCVGRKLVMRQRVEEELEGVRDVVGASTPLAGFYSYGELCPQAQGAPCELHNQTMTVTLLSEAL